MNQVAKKITEVTNNPGTMLDFAGEMFKGNAFESQGQQNPITGWANSAWAWLLDFGTPDSKKKPGSRRVSGTVSTSPTGDWRDAAQIGRDNEAARIIQAELDAEQNPATRAALQRELSRIRNGNMLSNGASSAARTLGRASGVRPAAAAQKVEVSIGNINLPGVTNAQEFARDLPGAMRANYSLAAQADYGSR